MPRLTVAHAVLKTKVGRKGGFRSSDLLTMLQKLELYEKSTTNEATLLAALKAAARKWRKNHPKEFTKRDKLSDYLCSKLLTELAIPPNMQEPPEPNCRAYQITNNPIGVGPLEPAEGTFKALDGSVLDAMRTRFEQDVPLGVIIIDVQTTHKLGALNEASRIANGLHVKYDSKSVLHNQADVVGLARDLKFPIFNVTASASGNMQTVAALTNKFPKDLQGVHDFNKTNNNVVGDMDVNKQPKFLTVLRNVMGNKMPSYLVIMGFNANQCVQGSVFGNRGKSPYKTVYNIQEPGYPKVKGLLEYGYTIVTARNILASACSPLEAAWGPMVAG